MTRGQWITGLIFAAIVAVVVTALFKREPSTEYDKKEREVHLEMIKRNSDRIARLSLDSLTIRQKMYSDSLKFSEALKANNEAYLKLKKKYNEINLSRADAHTLDSLVSGLYPD
jgi:hypothetical protein